jgi:predicted  nucleic acid-binding Zn-ribbon protein
VQDDFNAFKADVNHRFTSLRDALFDGDDRHFTDVEKRLNTLQRHFTALNDRLATFERGVTASNQQLTTYHDRLNHRFSTVDEQLASISHNVDPLSGRFDRVDQHIGAVRLQLTAIETRFDALER